MYDLYPDYRQRFILGVDQEPESPPLGEQPLPSEGTE